MSANVLAGLPFVAWAPAPVPPMRLGSFLVHPRATGAFLRRPYRERLGVRATGGRDGGLGPLGRSYPYKLGQRGFTDTLYPFGPKTLVFGLAVYATTEYRSGTWYVYPVPRSYDIDYTIGVGKTLWLALPAMKSTDKHSSL